MPETDALVINTGPLLALIAGIGNLSVLEMLYKRVFVPLEVCQEIEAGGSLNFGLSEFRESDFSMQGAINRMQSKGIYLSQKVIDFAFRQVKEQ